MVILLLAIVGMESFIHVLAPYNKGLQRAAVYPAAGIVLVVFVPLFVGTHFLPKPQAWVRWTVWSLTVFGLHAAVFAAVLSLGLVNRRPEVAGLILQMVGWGLVGIAVVSIAVLSLDLWRRKR